MVEALEQPPVGQRNAALRQRGFDMARAGATNHQILAELSELSERWGKYTDRNLHEKWTRLLGVVREIRSAGIRPYHRPPECAVDLSTDTPR